MHPSVRPVCFVLLSACTATMPGRQDQVPPPLPPLVNAYEAAAAPSLATMRPLELPGLHNVFRLSSNIVSGSEPHGEEAFAELERLGIKTILSVDGAAPDVETASRHGMRYVHAPIQYRGIADDELLRITKTFRELEGPFYVHCFHGKHRGPAAAAVGRCVLDGASRQQAIAEMRQWMGTSPEYQGLYQAIATHTIPTSQETAAYAYAFPAEQRAQGFVAAMSDMARVSDNLKDLARRGFAPDPEHPDLDALNEARKLRSLFETSQGDGRHECENADFTGWMEQSVRHARALVTALERSRQADAEATTEAATLVQQINKTCKSCHAIYRN